MALRLRKTGSYTRKRGRQSKVVDHFREKAALRALIEAETAQLERARRRLATGERMLLSQIGLLDTTEFQLMLDLLGEALSQMVGTGLVEVPSSDGTIIIEMEPTGDESLATITTSNGTLTGPDFHVRIRDAFARRSPRAAGALS